MDVQLAPPRLPWPAAPATVAHPAGPGRELRAFTLIELLVVIAIIAILIGFCSPRSRRSARRRRARCQNNLKQCAGLHNYHDVYNKFPGGTYWSTRYTTLFVELLPYVEQDPLYKQWDFTTHLPNVGRAGTVIKTYICLSHPDAETRGPGRWAVRPHDLRRQWRHAALPGGDVARDGIFHTTGPVSQPAGTGRRGHTLSTGRATRCSSASAWLATKLPYCI